MTPAVEAYLRKRAIAALGHNCSDFVFTDEMNRWSIYDWREFDRKQNAKRSEEIRAENIKQFRQYYIDLYAEFVNIELAVDFFDVGISAIHYHASELTLQQFIGVCQIYFGCNFAYAG